MRQLVTIAALVVLSGCSLDIARLYGTPDGSIADGGSPPVDAGDAGSTDGGDLDGGGERDGGAQPLELAIALTVPLTAGADAIAAGPSASGAVVAVSSRSSDAVNVWAFVPGEGCPVGLGASSVLSVAQPGPLALDDLDDDGQVDLAIGTDTSLAVAFGNVDDRYENPISITHSLGQLSALGTGDLDGDTIPEVVMFSAGPSIAWVTQTTPGSFSLTPGPSGSGIVYLDGVVDDLDADGALDLGAISASTSATQAVAIRGDGAGALLGPLSVAIPTSASRLAVSPATSVEGPSLVAAGESELWFGQVAGAALRGETQTVTGAQLRDVVVAELDGASPAEIVVADAVTSAIRVLHHAAGALSVAAPDLVLTSVPTEVVAVDVDHDGVDELVVLAGSQLLVLGRRCD